MRRDPARPILHLLMLPGVLCVGSVGVHVGSMRFFLIGCGYCPAQTPNARGFALQLNIGFSYFHGCVTHQLSGLIDRTLCKYC